MNNLDPNASGMLRVLDALGMTEKAVLVEKSSHPLGRVVRNIRSLSEEQVHYLSLLILPAQAQ